MAGLSSATLIVEQTTPYRIKQCAEQMLVMLVTSVILGLCVLILNSRAAKLISQLIGCVFRFYDSSFPFSAFSSELYFNHVFEYFRQTGLQELNIN